MVLAAVLLVLALVGLGAAAAVWLVRLRILAARRADAAEAAAWRAEDAAWGALADTTEWPTAGAPVVRRRLAGPDTEEVVIRPLTGAWLVVGRVSLGGVSRAVSVLVRNRSVTPVASMSPDALTPDSAASTLVTRRIPRGPLPGPAWGPWF